MRCPCSKCKNKIFLHVVEVENHLYRSGFVPNYYNWTLHGEELFILQEISSENNTEAVGSTRVEEESYVSTRRRDQHFDSNFQDMVCDVAGPSNLDIETDQANEIPNEMAEKFYTLLKSSMEPAFEGCTSENELSIVMKLLQAKNDYNLSEAAYNSICHITRNLIEKESKVPTSFHQTKRPIRDLGMGVIRIDACKKGCMICRPKGTMI